MRLIYPAYVKFDTDESAVGSFPDVEGCFFTVTNADDLYEFALWSLQKHFDYLANTQTSLPMPHSVNYHLKQQAKHYKNGQWFNISLDMQRYSSVLESIVIKLPQGLIQQIKLKINQGDYPDLDTFFETASRHELQSNLDE